MSLKKMQTDVDMINGPLIKNIIIFSMPLMFGSILQLLYNAADMVVVGQFAESGSIGAIGATSALCNLIVSTVVSLSVGACVLVARRYGAGDMAGINRAVHTSITAALVLGAAVGIFGFIFTRPLLVMIDVPADIIDRSEIYMKIYFIGAFFNIVYNFGAAVMRAVGETKRPFYYLMFAGLANVVLNLFFTALLGMGVAGVAIGTVASQMITCVCAIVFLIKTSLPIKLNIHELKIDFQDLLELARVSIPSAIQCALFAISNITIQSSINSFGSAVVEGNAAAASIDGLVYTSMHAVSQASVTFVSQNYGAKKYHRINRILVSVSGVCAAVGIVLCIIIAVLRRPLLMLYLKDVSSSSASFMTAQTRFMIWLPLLFTCGIMECICEALRGLGYSFTPMFVALVGSCLARIAWIYTVFAAIHTMECLYISFPVSWILTALVQFACYVFAIRRLKRKEPRYFLKIENENEREKVSINEK